MTEYKKSLGSLSAEERKAAVQAMKATLKPLHDNVKSIHADIQKLREAKKAEWVNFHNAVKAKDSTAAETALKAIISLKSQIIEKQGPLMEAKNSILAALTAK